MLLGTDIQAVLTILSALDVDVIGLNCSTGPEDMRDAIRFLGEHSPGARRMHPERRPAAAGARGRDDLPRGARAAVEGAGRSSSSATASRSSAAAAARRRSTSRRSSRRSAAARPASAPRTRGARTSSSMMTATPLVQEPRPTLVGERVNSQGSRKAKEMLLADDYDGLVQIAEDQVEGGAHVLDLCVALTERQDEDEQMRQVAKRVALTQPAPLQIDTTEPDVMKIALEQNPGPRRHQLDQPRGRRATRPTRSCRWRRQHGAALIALTIDEVGMAKTAERKLEIAKRIHDLCVDDHGFDPELLIFDVLTFTLTTGDEEWRPSAIETIEGIRLLKKELPAVKTSLGVSNVSFGVSPPRPRGPEQRLPAPLRRGRARPGDGQPEPHHALRRDLGGGARARRRPRLQQARGRARSASSSTSSRRARTPRPRWPTPPRAWSPRRRSTGTSCAARRTASRS